MSHYQASPGLFVQTDSDNAKINFNEFGKSSISKEKITKMSIQKITDDSVQIHFTASGTALKVKEEYIGVNIKYAVHSILGIKKKN